MLVALPDRIPVHLVDFGHLVEPGTGLPIRALGRDRIRITHDFPRGCLALALPGRIAAHIGGLPLALSADTGQPDAILILPAFAQEEGLAFHSMVIQRVTLHPEQEHPARPGDSARSRGVAIDSAAWNRLAPTLVDQLDDKVPVEPIASTVMAHHRLDIPRQMMVCQTYEPGVVSQLTDCTRQILAALIGGHHLRLNAEDCPDRRSFMRHLAFALEMLPKGLRGGLSASIGLTRPDSAFQLGWAPELNPVRLFDDQLATELAQLDPDMPLSEAGMQLFQAPQTLGPEIARYAGDALHDGLIVSTRDDCGIMPAVRGWVAMHSQRHPPVSVRVDKDCSFAMRLASLWQEGKLDGAVARSLIDDLLSGRVLQPPQQDDAILASAFALITAQQDAPFELEAAALALDLAAFACDGADSRANGEEIAARTKAEIYAYLTAAPMLAPEGLAVIVSHARLAEFVAGLIHSRDERIVWRLRNVMAMVELLGTEGQALAARAIQTLAPRDGRTYSEWNYRPADASDLQQVLAILVSDRVLAKRDLDRDVRAIATRLIALERRDLLVEAMQSAVMALDMALPQPGTERAEVVTRQLEVVSLISAALLQDGLAIDALKSEKPGLKLQA